MKKIIIAISLVLVLAFTTPVFAQAADPQFQLQACYGKLQDELLSGLQWRMVALQAQAQVKTLQDQLNALKAPKNAPRTPNH